MRVEAGVITDSVARGRVDSGLAVNAGIAVVIYGIVLYLYYVQPVAYIYFVIEDHWSEWGQFAAWAACSTLLFWGIVRRPALRKPGIVAFAVGALLVALEEISWGQRVLGFDTPAMLAEQNTQNEANLHNLVNLPHQLAGSLLILWCIAPYLLRRRMGALFDWLERVGIPMIPVRVWPLFLLSSALLIYPPLIRVQGDEIAELFLSIAFAVLALDLVASGTSRSKVTGRRAIQAPVLILTLGAITFVLVGISPAPYLLHHDLNQVAAYRYPAAGLYNQADQIFRYIDRNPIFLDPDTRYHHGLILTRLGRRDEAAVVLEQALADQNKPLAEGSAGYVESIRTRAGILALIGRKTAADPIFEKALDLDYQRLDNAVGAADRADIRWSIARTLYTMGNIDAALEEFSRAENEAPDAETKKWMWRWLHWEQARDAANPGRPDFD